MKIIRSKLIFIIFIFVLTLSLSGIFIYNYFKVDIEKVLESEEYSYLPDEAKDYVKKAYDATGEVILTEKNKKKNQVYLNPSYINYLQLSSKEKENVSNIPDPYTIEYDLIKTDNDLVLPSSYDLRNHNGKNFVSPMKDQSTTGLCWAFTTGEQIESLLMKNSNSEYVDGKTQLFSVRQLDYATSDNGIYKYDNINGYRNLGAGGNFLMAGVALSNAIGLADDSFLPFNISYSTRPLENVMGYGNISLYEANTTAYIPGFNFDSDYTSEDLDYYIDYVKSYVYSYGGAYVGTESPEGSCGSLNVDGTAIIRVDNSCVENSGHAMHVIGWDDNYTYQYCKTGSYHSSNVASCSSNNLVEGKGAWLLKNSWGTAIHPGYQYLYLAYDSLGSTFGVTTEVESLSQRTWDNNYHDNFFSDENGYVVSNEYDNYTKKFSGNEKLEKVKFLAYAVDGTYRVNVTVGSKVYSNIQTINVELPGVQTFDLSEENIIIDNNSFKVQIIGANGSGLVSGTISTFTSNVDSKVEADIPDVNVKKIYTNNAQTNYEFSILGYTKNINPGDTVTYKLFDGNNDITHNLTVLNDISNDGVVQSKVANNEVLSIFYEAGTYTLKMYYAGKEIASSNIVLNGIIFINGSGTEDDPYILTTEEELEIMRDKLTCSEDDCYFYYVLGNDITLTKKWTPIGTAANPFSGMFDGYGYTISGLDVSSGVSGFFGYAVDSIIGNVNFDSPNVVGTSHSGVVAGYAYNVIVGLVGINGGSVKSTGGSAGSLIGRYEVVPYETAIFSIYNSSTVSGYTSSGLIGTVANGSAYTNTSCKVMLVDIMNVGNINFKGFNGNVSKSSLLIGEVNNSIVYLYNAIVTGRVLDDELINYNSIIGTYNKATCVTSGDMNNVYYVNGNDSVTNGSSLGIGIKKSVTDLVKSSTYTDWVDFEDTWKYNSYQNIPRLPSPSFVDYEYTVVDEITIGMDKGGNLLDYISPKIDAAKNITVSNVDSKYLTVDAGLNMKGVKTGKTTIHITSDYDGFEKDININIVAKANPVITFNSNDGKNLSEKQTVKSGESFILNANKFVREGYILKEWNTKSDGSGDSYKDKQSISSISDDLTLYAIWREINYKVVYNYNGEFDNIEVSLKYSDEVNVHSNTYKRENYTFKEWNTKSDGTGKSYYGKISKLTTVDGDVINLYAIWKLDLTFGSDKYKVDESNKLIDMIEANTSVDDFKKNINMTEGFKIVVETKNNLIYTGGKTKIYDSNDKLIVEFVNVIRGDINGDGKISALDYVKVKNHIMKANIIDSDSIYFKAADANTDNTISALDYVRIKNIIMKGAN